MGKFKSMPKMETTEPSVELKLKKGGKVKKMQMGGALPVAASPEMMPKRRRMAQSMAKPMARPMAQPMMSKKGGEIESKAEMKKIGKVEKELKSHESKPASKGHKGLKTGGAIPRFKEGGHVAMTGKKEGGYTQMKKMAKC